MCPVSALSIYALSPSSKTPSPFPPPFLGFFLSLAALLVACGTSSPPLCFYPPLDTLLSELISALIPSSPLLLPAALALVSRAILLTLAVATAVLLRHRRAAIPTESKMEKGRPANDSSAGRVSSPTQATWPFPGSLVAVTRTHHVAQDAFKIDDQNLALVVLLPLVLTITQIFATLVAALSVAACLLADATTHLNQPLTHILLVSATCTLLWSFAALAIIQSESDSFSTISSSHVCHSDKYFLPIPARLPRRSMLR